MQEPIALREYESCLVDLDAEDTSFIAAELSRKIAVWREPQGSGYMLNPGSYVGVVTLPSGRLLSSSPKVDVRNVFHMLGVAYKLWSSFRTEIVPFERVDELFEFIVQYFAKVVEKRIDEGLYRSYVEVEDNLSNVKGRIDFIQDVRHNYVLRHRTYCRYAEFTWDVPENQIIRQVAHMLSGWALRPETRNRLGGIDTELAEVTPTTMPAIAIDRFRYHRLNDEYRAVHQLCRLFLEGASLSEELGTFSSRAFLIDMNRLFEVFVTEVLRDRFRAPYLLSDQVPMYLGYNKSVPIRPDILLSRSARPVLVADCKYKPLEPGEFKNHDIYQMLAYCTSLRLRRGLLIYPRHMADVASEVAILNTEIVIRQTTLDLAKTGTDLVTECDRLAQDMSLCVQGGVVLAAAQVA